jgi:acyl-CoA reductase-like NAD-dependent aldehyde dehydrogenase
MNKNDMFGIAVLAATTIAIVGLCIWASVEDQKAFQERWAKMTPEQRSEWIKKEQERKEAERLAYQKRREEERKWEREVEYKLRYEEMLRKRK